mmetsp:Transcript_7376/g.21221  ORF Transcript_7376/g.21221 Transcript_7376/m.21221 type:complete len:92 (+) Transcript_7376:364-639(+)
MHIGCCPSFSSVSGRMTSPSFVCAGTLPVLAHQFDLSSLSFAPLPLLSFLCGWLSLMALSRTLVSALLTATIGVVNHLYRGRTFTGAKYPR